MKLEIRLAITVFTHVISSVLLACIAAAAFEFSKFKFSLLIILLVMIVIFVSKRLLNNRCS